MAHENVPLLNARRQSSEGDVLSVTSFGFDVGYVAFDAVHGNVLT